MDPDLTIHSTVTKGYCVHWYLEEAIELFSMRQKRGVTPGGILFNSILEDCARRQMRTLPERVLRDMEAAKVPSSTFTLSILVKLFGRLGDADKAFEVMETYPAKYGFEPRKT